MKYTEIVIKFKDGTKFEANKIRAVTYLAGTLIILMDGLFGGLDSKEIDDGRIESFEVKIGEY